MSGGRWSQLVSLLTVLLVITASAPLSAVYVGAANPGDAPIGDDATQEASFQSGSADWITDLQGILDTDSSLDTDDTAEKRNGSSRIENGLLPSPEGEGDNSADGNTDATQSASTDTVYEVILVARPGYVDSAKRAVANAGGSVGATANGKISAQLTAAGVRSVANASGVSFVRAPSRPVPTAVPENQGLDDMRVLSAQDNGYTGEKATVAVIDFEGGFNAENDEVKDNVVATKDIGDNTFENRTGGHGTATAEVVTDTAPNASLVLISISNYVELQKSIDYIDQRGDVDAAVMSFSFFGADPTDGTSDAAREISDSVENGTLYFTSAGNYGDRQHLNQTYTDTDGDGIHEFDTSGDSIDERLDLGLRSVVDGEPTVEVYVQWNDWENVNEDYDLRLINSSTGKTIDNSTKNQTGILGQRPVEGFSIDTSQQNISQLDVQVVNKAASGTAEFDIFIYNGGKLTDESTAARSITVPGTAEDAVTVGAVNAFDNTLEPFSSQGPTIDERRKPDLVAVDNISTSVAGFDPYFGTSASAPSAAGVAALVVDANSSASAANVESAILGTSRFVTGRTKPNNQTGVGLVNANAATAAVSTTSTSQVDINTTDLLGNGTTDDPYQISNASELQAMEDDLDASYEIVADIDASNTALWNDGRGFDPVGGLPVEENTPTSFNGSLDGNGHSVTGFTIDRETENATGLIGAAGAGSQIQDVTVSGSVSGQNAVGVVVGGANSTIQDVTASGRVTGSEDVGGIVGAAIADTEIRNSTASVTVTGSDFVGGFAGRVITNTTIQNVTASGEVDGVGATGGLVGFNGGNNTVRNAAAFGNVTGVGDVGGLVGTNINGATIRNATASGTVEGDEVVGGFAGRNQNGSVIRDSEASGNVSGSDFVGGFVGYNFESRITAATSSRSVTVPDPRDNVGGFIGLRFGGIIEDVTASGLLNGISPIAIRHNDDGAGASGTDSASGDELAAEDLGIELVTSGNFVDTPEALFGGDSNTTLRIQNGTGRTVTIEPEPGEPTFVLTGDTEIDLDIYTGNGEIDEQPDITVINDTGETFVDVNVTVSGNTSMFSSGVPADTDTEPSRPFDNYTIDFVNATGDTVSSTNPRLIGIGYNAGSGVEQNSTAGKVKFTIPRERTNEGINESWFVQFSLDGDMDELEPVPVENRAADGNFSIVVDVGDLSPGKYSSSFELYRQKPSESSGFENRILNIFGVDNVVIESPTETAPAIIAPPDAEYNPAKPFTIGTGHNATGVINNSDVAIRLVNVTNGNNTVVAVNDSVPAEGDANTTIPANSFSGNVTVQTQLYNASSQQAVANDTVNLTSVDTPSVTETAPVIIAPPDAEYDPTQPFTIGTAHNATGVISGSDGAIRLVNVTDGNNTVVAVNDSVPVEGGANTTIPAGTVSGNVTIQTQLYDTGSQQAVANDTVNLTAEPPAATVDVDPVSAGADAVTVTVDFSGDVDGGTVFVDVEDSGGSSLLSVSSPVEVNLAQRAEPLNIDLSRTVEDETIFIAVREIQSSNAELAVKSEDVPSGDDGGGGLTPTSTPTPTTTTATPTDTTTTSTPTDTTTTEEPEISTSTSPPETTDSTAPGFGPLVAIAALLAGAALGLRRRN